MKQVRFSVVVTVFNLGAFLKECLESIQTASIGHDVELIVVDDGSNEIETIQIIDSLKDLYPSINLFRKDNGGPASARNFGIKHSSGEFIIPFDADNRMRAGFFSSLSYHLDKTYNQYDVYHFNALFFGLKDLVWPGSDFKLQDIAIENRVDACTCIRRESLIAIGGFDEILVLKGFEDWELWIRMLSYGKRFYYIDEILYDYRVREHSTLAESWIKRMDALNHMFAKPENHLMAEIRRLSLMNHELKKPFTFNQIINLFINKIKFKIFNVKG